MVHPNNLAGYSVKNIQQELNAHPELFDVELGRAIGDMYAQKGSGGVVYRRDFQNGIVLVNPSHARIPGL